MNKENLHNSAFAKLRTASRRLAILRFLAEEPDYTLNTSVLEDALEAIGLAVSRAVLHMDGVWLENLEIIKCESIGNIRIFELTRTGLDVVAGKLVVDGIKRPCPRG